MENNVELYKILKIPERKMGNPDGVREYCKIFPIFANLEERCPIR